MFRVVYPNKVAIFDGKNKFKYKDLELFSDLVSKIIQKNKVLIFLDATNSIPFFFLYYFLIKSNHAIFLVDDSLNLSAVKKLLQSYKPKYYFTNRLYKFENTNEVPVKDIFPYKILSFQTKIKYSINKDIKILLSTSGSLGDPKCVKLSYENLRSNTKSIIKYLKLNHDDKTFTTLNPSYSYGMSVINTHLFSNASIFVSKLTLFDKNFYQYFKKFKITNINGVPYFYDMLVRLGLKKISHKNLRFITQAGGALSEKSFQSIKHFILKEKKTFYIMYGQTEASPRISYKKIDSETKISNNSIGNSISGGKLYLKKKSVNKNSNKIIGELIYEGKNIFCGYSYGYKDLEKISYNRTLKTGDLAYKKNNEFYIYGRVKREIKLFGHRINLDYIQNDIFRKYENICIFKNNYINIYSEQKIDLKNIKNLNEFIKKRIILHKVKKLPRLKNNKFNYKYFYEK